MEPLPYQRKEKPSGLPDERRRAARTMLIIGIVSLVFGGPSLVANMLALLFPRGSFQFNAFTAVYQAVFVYLGIMQIVSSIKIRGGSILWHGVALQLLALQVAVLVTIIPMLFLLLTGFGIRERLGLTFMIIIYGWCLFNASLDVKSSRRELMTPMEDDHDA